MREEKQKISQKKVAQEALLIQKQENEELEAKAKPASNPIQKTKPKTLSDQTKVNNMTWLVLKASAMKEDYQKQNWYSELDQFDIELLEALRSAQEK